MQISSKVTPNTARLLGRFTVPSVSTALPWRPGAAVVSKRRYPASDLLNGLVEGCLDSELLSASAWMSSGTRSK